MQKRLMFIPLVLAVVVSVMLTGCPSGGSSSTGSGGGGSPTTPSGGGTINGLVTDFNTGVKLAGVTVTDNAGQTTTTDSKGAFTLSGYASGSSVPVTLDMANYARGHSTAIIGVNAAPVVLPLKKEIGPRVTYDPTLTKTISFVTEDGPYALTLGANTLNVTGLTGPFKVSVTPLDPTKESSVLPSGLADSTTTSSTVMLVPLTFADFSIFDSTGARVQLNSGATATVEMPIPPALRSNTNYALGKIIHCYAYNPVTGKWDNFITGIIVLSSVDNTTPVLKANILHFSWYGGAPQNTNCIDVYGRVVSAVDGKPLPYARVEAFPGTVATSDANGNFVVTTTATGANSFTATRTFIDTDGSVSGMVGAKVIEYGKVVDELAGLVSRPCTNPPPAPPIPPTTPPTVTVKIGGVSLLSYKAEVYMMNGVACAMLNESIPPNGTAGNTVSGAIISLKGPSGTISLPEISQSPGTYCAFGGSAVTPGATYTVNIDADHNGTVDGTGTATAVGTLAWTLPVNSQPSYSAATFTNAAWTDSAFGTTGYSVVYYAIIQNTGTGSTSVATYIGSNLNFTPLDMTTKAPLLAGSYTASVMAFSGSYSAAGGSWVTSSNITGSTVSGRIYSYGAATPVSFTLQ